MKLFYATTLLVILSICFWPTESRTFSQQPPVKATGAPGESDCGNEQCHNQPALKPPEEVSVIYNDNDLTYDGQIKEITISLNFPNKNKFGFEMTALSDLGEGTPGAFITNNPLDQTTLTTLVDGATREYICHFMADNTNTWTFQWESPSNDLGDITFYYAVNASDGNGSPETGDEIFKDSFIVTHTTVGINDLNNSNLVSINQLPNSTQYQLKYNHLKTGTYQLTAYSLLGNLLVDEQVEINNAAGSVDFNLNSLFKTNQIVVFNLSNENYFTTIKHLHH